MTETLRPTTRPREAGSKTLDNGIGLLQALARHPDGMTVTALSRECGVHRTVAYRLLRSLTRATLVEQRRDGTYVVGLGVLELAGSVRATLQDAAAAPLRQLADDAGATAFLAVRQGEDVVSVAVVEPAATGVHVSYRVGQRHPADIGADGMALLAGEPPVPDERPEVTAARAQGYVISQGEIERGAWGLAAPVVSRTGVTVASVGVVALRALPEEEVAAKVTATARTVGQRVGS